MIAKYKKIIISGGAGIIGQDILDILVNHYEFKGEVIVFDCNEDAIFNLAVKYKKCQQIKFLTGDILDTAFLDRIFPNADMLIHAAAKKHVLFGEANPTWYTQINVYGSQVILNKCVQYAVRKVIHISTDKAVEALNAYGNSKSLAEKICMDFAKNNLCIDIVVLRLVNYVHSNGNVVEYLNKDLTNYFMSDPDITRFFMTKNELYQTLSKALDVKSSILTMAFNSVSLADLVESIIPSKQVTWQGRAMYEKKCEKLFADAEFEFVYTDDNTKFFTIDILNPKPSRSVLDYNIFSSSNYKNRMSHSQIIKKFKRL